MSERMEDMRFRSPNIVPGGVAKGWVGAEVARDSWLCDQITVIETMIEFFQYAAFPRDYVILGPVAVQAIELANTKGTYYVRVVAPMMRAEDYDKCV